tara:strand:- start:1780 stop:1995 length:216 start_codon:yes stop_codon:yes gene_type:complete
MPRKKKMSPEDLKKYAILRRKLINTNNDLPHEKQLSTEQIEQSVRHAVKMGLVNESGNVVEMPWGSDQQGK